MKIPCPMQYSSQQNAYCKNLGDQDFYGNLPIFKVYMEQYEKHLTFYRYMLNSNAYINQSHRIYLANQLQLTSN